MELLGGLPGAGEHRREFRFRPVTGRLELQLAEAAEGGARLPEQVTAALVAALESLGGGTPSDETVRCLCVADRQFLMHRLAEHLGVGRVWLTWSCNRCGQPFDVAVDLGDLPVKGAGAGFPALDVETSRGRLRARVPTGADQVAVARVPEAEAHARLLACCVSGQAEGVSGDDLARIEAALEEMSPAVVTRLAARCPECGGEQSVPVDPYLCLAPRAELFEEVHRLSSTYHWSEREILDLPRARRRRYLALADRARGTVG